MRDMPDMSRRMVLGASAMLAFSNTAACAQDDDTARTKGRKILVAYLTRSGNTRVIAETLHLTLNADLFEIRPIRQTMKSMSHRPRRSGPRAMHRRWLHLSPTSHPMMRYSSDSRSEGRLRRHPSCPF